MREIRAFVAVYHTGQVSAAAEKLALTQPAVTVLLREFETKLGIRLFDRTSRGLRRTQAATEAIVYAERMFAEIGALQGRMVELAAGRSGVLRLACTATTAQTVLPSMLRTFAASHPDVRIEIVDVSPRDFVETIRGERIAFGIGTLEEPVRGLEEETILTDTLCAVGPPSDGFATQAPVSWKTLATRPIVTVRAGYGIRRSIDAAATQAGVRLNIVHEVTLLASAVALADAGLGIAIVPRLVTVHAGRPGLLTRRIVRPAVSRAVSLVRRSDVPMDPVAAAFRRTVLAASVEATRAPHGRRAARRAEATPARVA